MNRQKMLMFEEDEKECYKRRASLWSKGRKLARENIKALKNQFEVSEDPIQLAAFDPKTTYEKVYRNAFGAVKAGDPDFYGDVTVDDMMEELGQPNSCALVPAGI